MRKLRSKLKNNRFQLLLLPFTARIKCFSDLKFFSNSQPSASNFKSFSRSKEHFFLTMGQNNFGNKIPKCIYQKNDGDKSPCPCMFRSAWDHCGANSYRNFSVSWYVAPTDLLSRLMSASKHKGAFCFNTVHLTNIFDLKTMVKSCLVKNVDFKTRDFSLLINRVLAGVK